MTRTVEKERRYVNLMSDAGFKAVFADPTNKQLLIKLLNYVLTPGVKVRDISRYIDREQRVDYLGGKQTVLDLVCEDVDGKILSVEVQRSEEESFYERCAYYASGLYHRSLAKKSPYKKLRPVYVTAIVDYVRWHENEALWDTDNFIAHYAFFEWRTFELGKPTIFINFAELGRFTKTASECRTEKDWLFFWFKHGWEHDSVPDNIAGESFLQSLADACEIAAFSAEKKQKYENDMLTPGRIPYAKGMAASIYAPHRPRGT